MTAAGYSYRQTADILYVSVGSVDSQASFEAFLGEGADLIRNIHGVATVADEIGYMVATTKSL